MANSSTSSDALSEIMQNSLSKNPELAAKQARLLKMLKGGMKLPPLDGSTDSPTTEAASSAPPASSSSTKP